MRAARTTFLYGRLYGPVPESGDLRGAQTGDQDGVCSFSATGITNLSSVSKQKFRLFVRDTFEPVTIVVAAFDAGIGQAQDTDPTFGQGAAGYGSALQRRQPTASPIISFIRFSFPHSSGRTRAITAWARTTVHA